MIEDGFEEADPEFERRMAHAAPPTTDDTNELRVLIAAMSGDAVRADRMKRHKRLSAGAAIAVPVLVLGGAGAAFASTAIDWSAFFGHTTTWEDWAEAPEAAAVRVTLPSGATCELRFAVSAPIGAPADSDSLARAQDALRAYLSGETVIADADIDAVLSNNGDLPNFTRDGESSPVPYGPGTGNDNPDVDYHEAALEGVSKAIAAHVPGIGPGGLGMKAQENCDDGAGR